MSAGQDLIIDRNKSALDFHIANVDRFQQLCDPLKYLGTPIFGYMKIFDDARYLHICNHDKWSRYFFQNVHNTGRVFSKVISVVDSNVISFVWPNETTDGLLLNLKDHNIFHGITFYRRRDNFIENWSFCAPPENTEVYELYLKRTDLLWKFAQYFNEAAEDLIDHSESRKLGFYKNEHNIFAPKEFLKEEDIERFLQDIEIKKYFIKYDRNWTFISEKEKICLELALKGTRYSDKICFSPNIIDAHLNAVRIRLGAASRNELLHAFQFNFSIK
jgi:hypothetical protein